MKLCLLNICVFSLVFSACEHNSGKVIETAPNSRKSHYEKQMRIKDYKFYQVDECENESEKVLHSDTAYVEWIMDSKKGKVVQFNLRRDCQSEFMSDFSTRNDTLVIELENISETYSLCSCLFVYRMEISTGNKVFNEILFQEHHQ